MALIDLPEAKVDKSGPNGCWVWTAGRSHGYGILYIDGKQVRAHVLALSLALGVWPDPSKGEQVCHHCDNKACCNPEHLYVGTNRSNALDRYERGRKSNFDEQTHCKQGHPLAGDNLKIYVKNGYVTRRCRACGREMQRR